MHWNKYYLLYDAFTSRTLLAPEIKKDKGKKLLKSSNFQYAKESKSWRIFMWVFSQWFGLNSTRTTLLSVWEGFHKYSSIQYSKSNYNVIQDSIIKMQFYIVLDIETQYYTELDMETQFYIELETKSQCYTELDIETLLYTEL